MRSVLQRRRLVLAVIGLTLLASSAMGCVGLALSRAPANTPSPAPAFTPSTAYTLTASASPTLTPSPTATPHPLTIESMRMRDYPGSEVTREQELEPGANYDRFPRLILLRRVEDLRTADRPAR